MTHAPLGLPIADSHYVCSALIQNVISFMSQYGKFPCSLLLDLKASQKGLPEPFVPLVQKQSTIEKKDRTHGRGQDML